MIRRESDGPSFHTLKIRHQYINIDIQTVLTVVSFI